MKVLVTGGCGFIGSHLVDKLVAEGHTVHVYDDYSAKLFYRNPKANYTEIDCRNMVHYSLDDMKPDIVYHLAANAAENKAQFSPIDITSRNYDAFIKVVTASIHARVKRFIFISSIAVYGSLQTPFKETEKCEPEDLYGVTKLAAEESLKILAKVHDFEYVIARPHNVYGERQNMKDPYRNVVTIWMNAILRNKPIYIYGEGKQVRQFSYIDDVVASLFYMGLGSWYNYTANVGSSKAITLNQLFDLIKEVTGYDKDPVYLPMRPQEVMEAIADHSQFKTTETPIRKGLEKTWKWCKQQGAQEPLFDTLEIPNKKVPENWL